MYSGFSPFNHICRHQLWQTFQPQARCFRFPVPELPWLNDLVRLSDACRNDTDWIFQCNSRDRGIEQCLDKDQGFGLLPDLVFEPATSAHRQMRARWMRNHQVPPHVQQFGDITLVVWPFHFCGQEITAHCVVIKSTEGVSYSATVLTGNKNPHGATFSTTKARHVAVGHHSTS